MLRINLLILLICFFKSVYADEENGQWQLITDEDGIQVYTIDLNNTDIVKAKAITVISSTMSRIRQELDDIDSRHEWVPFLKQSRLIVVNSNTRHLEYSLFSAPWPASNRDFVYSMELVLETDEQFKYEMKSVLSDRMPEQAGLIRGEIFESNYIITKLDENLTRVELVYHADPKGWLPNWIVNIIQEILPHKILRNLRRRVE